MHDPETRSLTGTGWRAYGAYVDPLNKIPGPGASDLHRVGNKLHAYAWFQHRVPSTIEPEMSVFMAITVGEITTLKSALVLAGAPGRPELRVDWTTSRPRTTTLIGAESVLACDGNVTAEGRVFWRLSLSLTNTAPRPIHVMPTFYVTRGVENAGLDLGMHAGDAHFEVTEERHSIAPQAPGGMAPSADIDWTGASR